MLIRIALALIGVILYLAVGIVISVVAVLWKGLDSDDAAPWIIFWPCVVVILLPFEMYEKLVNLLDWILKKVRKS